MKILWADKECTQWLAPVSKKAASREKSAPRWPESLNIFINVKNYNLKGWFMAEWETESAAMARSKYYNNYYAND